MSTLKVESLRHYDADSDALVLSADGRITFNGTIDGFADSAQVQAQFDSAFPSAFDTRFVLQDTHDSAAVQAQFDSAFPGAFDTRLSGNVSLGNMTTTGYLRGPATFTIDPAVHGDSTGTVMILGNLQVEGSTTTINSTTLTVNDKNIVLADSAANAAAADGAGITVAGANATITYDATNDEWDFNRDVNITGSLTTSSSNALYAETSYGSVQVRDTSTTGQELHVRNNSGKNGFLSFTENAIADRWLIGVEAGDASLLFKTGNTGSNTERMRIDGNGNLGIGTANPNALLDLAGATVSSSPILRFTGTGNASQGDVIGQIEFYNSDETDNTAGVMGKIRAIAGPSGGEGSLQFLVDMPSEGADANTVALHLNANGNVGIGTSSPDGSDWNASSNLLHIFQNDTNGSLLKLESSNTTAVLAAGNNQFQIGTIEAQPFKFYTGNSERMRIDASGNVGIGTESPSHALEVYRLVPPSGIISRFASGSSGGWIQLADTNGSWQMGSTSNGLEFYADAPTSQYRLTLSSSGNLGIGTRTPGYTLTVNKDTGSTPTVYINNSGSNATEGVALKVQASGRGVGVKDADVFSVHNNAGEIFTVRNDGYAEAAAGFAVPFKHFPDASFGAAGTSTGRIKIALPDTSNDYDMVTIELTVYQYNDTAGSKILISGHNWSNNGWYNVSVQVIGKYNKSIKLARSTSDNKYYILLGDTTDSWSYATVHVNEVTTAPFYNTITDWTQGWSITQVSADSTTYSAVSGNYNTTGSRTLRTNGYVNSSGIIFGSDTAAANALDDYEEGTWTPVANYHTTVTDTSTTNATINGSGWYRKIGSQVTVYAEFLSSSTANYVYKHISGLPFTANGVNLGNLYVRGGRFRYGANTRTDCYFYSSVSNTIAGLSAEEIGSTGFSGWVEVVGTSQYVKIQVTYKVN